MEAYCFFWLAFNGHVLNGGRIKIGMRRLVMLGAAALTVNIGLFFGVIGLWHSHGHGVEVTIPLQSMQHDWESDRPQQRAVSHEIPWHSVHRLSGILNRSCITEHHGWCGGPGAPLCTEIPGANHTCRAFGEIRVDETRSLSDPEATATRTTD